MNRVALAVAAPAPRVVPAHAPTADEERFLRLLNDERRSNGLAPLTFDPVLWHVARQHSEEMATLRYFAHESPTPGRRTPMQRYLSAAGRRPSYLLVGENLFYSSAVGVERGHRALMASESHRRNILDTRFEGAGIGVYVSPDGRYWVTQMFNKRRS